MHATGLSDLLRRSAAARNSIYQHFPGGKTELMVAVTEAAGTKTAARIDDLAAGSDPTLVLSGMIRRWMNEMQRTDFGTGCPIAAASLAGPDEPSITEAAARAFTLVRDRVSAALVAAGADVGAADSTASFAVSAIEGALLQARAQRSVQPLLDVEAELLRRLP
ncbi:MAG: TetR family transcriptional regulator [Mycobacterium sp.]|nr:TetR family transcriptional regulator [Mycobacterium sp.]